MATITELRTTPHTRIENEIIEEYTPQIGLSGLGVYVLIKKHLNQKNGQCNPSYKTLAKKAGVDRSTIIRYVKKLKAFNLIDPELRFKEDGSHASNQYNFSPTEHPTPQKPVNPVNPANQDTSDKGGGTAAPPVVLQCHDPSGNPATTPSAPVPPEQSSSLNKKERTSSDVALLPTEKQLTCPHPTPVLIHLPADKNHICLHCWGLLDENLKLITSGVLDSRALPECEVRQLADEPEGKHPPEAKQASVAA